MTEKPGVKYDCYLTEVTFMLANGVTYTMTIDQIERMLSRLREQKNLERYNPKAWLESFTWYQDALIKWGKQFPKELQLRLDRNENLFSKTPALVERANRTV